MRKTWNNKILLAAIILLIAAAATAYAARHTDSSVPALIAGQAVPAGITVMKKQAARLWPELSGRLKIS